jgi:eukaryotic-like serine/threonine-protein kinase
MEAERWKQVDELLQAALQVPFEQRDEFLHQACAGDVGLEQEVRSLLASDQSAGDFLEGHAIKDAAKIIALNEVREAGDVVLGQTISHYRVLKKLGSGGMGAVYEAEDIRLGRHVALKLLLDSRATSSKDRQRFEQEARAISSLNHPNICTLYEVEEYDNRLVIVMELLEGQTLEQRMRSGPVQLPQLLEWGIEVADALDEAHAAGLVHRDIKPANLFITGRGRAKVLDFGLAKLTAKGASLAETADDDPLTSLGVIPGTTPYMSPEQVRGDDLDGRTDIFSLGTVLYEMATGERPFAERNIVLTMNAVLNKRPTPPTKVNPELPTELERVIDKTLEKDRGLRYQSAADIRNDLQGLKHALDSGQPVTSGPAAAVVTPLVRETAGISNRRAWTIALLAAAAVVAVGFAIYTFIERSRTAPFQDFTIAQITNTGKAESAALSPDAKYILHVQNDTGGESLWLSNIATGSNTQVLPSTHDHYHDLAFSPDGNYVYFLKRVAPSTTDLYRLAVLGGTPRRIAPDVDTGVTFSPDSHKIAYVRANDPEVGKFRLLSANPDGSGETVLDVEPITNGGNEAFPRSVAWTPSGNKIAYSYGRYASQPGILTAFDLGEKRQSLLVRLPRNTLAELSWLSEKRLLAIYSEGGSDATRRQLGIISLDKSKLQPVTRDTNSYSSLTLSADNKVAATVQRRTNDTLELSPVSRRTGYAFSAPSTPVAHVSAFDWTIDGNLITTDGSQLVRSGGDGSKPLSLINDRNATILGVASCANGYILIAWAFHADNEGSTIWRTDSDGSNPQQLTHGNHDASPTCTPDGKWVYYIDNMLSVMRIQIEGGQPEVVPGIKIPNLLQQLGGITISKDGRRMFSLVSTTRASPGEDPEKSAYHEGEKIAIVDLDAGPATALVLNPDSRATASLFTGSPKLSPDGTALGYVIREKGAENLWMQPLNGSPGRQITHFPSSEILDFRWSPDGKMLAIVRESLTSDVVLLRDTTQ